jgi:hypothetical protein
MEATTQTTREVRQTVQLFIWTLAWVASLALAMFGNQLWGRAPIVSWIAIGLNIVVGAGWIVAHARFLRAVGELQRKVQLEAMGLALGVGIVGSCALAAANVLGLVALEADAAAFAIIAAVVYSVATLIGNLRYR